MIYQNNSPSKSIFEMFFKILFRMARAKYELRSTTNHYEEEQKIWREEKLRIFY